MKRFKDAKRVYIDFLNPGEYWGQFYHQVEYNKQYWR